MSVSYQLNRWPSRRSRPSVAVRVASIRSMSPAVVMNPRSWAASVESSPMPMLVGEVRCATRGSGVTWKLSGGKP